MSFPMFQLAISLVALAACLDGPREPNSWLCDGSATVDGKVSLLKRLYGSKVAEPAYKACKLLDMAKKDTKFGGEGKYAAIRLTQQASGSATFADALATQQAAQEVRFFVQHKKQYVIFSIQRDAINRSQGDANALMAILKTELDSARKKWGRMSSRRIYGKHGGAIARLNNSTVATATATLGSRSDVAAFERNQQIEFASDDGSPTVPAGRFSSGSVPVRRTVSSVNRTAGTVTFDDLLNTVPGIATTSYMFWRGDYANVMTGLRGWCPETDPSPGESFFGLDRTAIDISRASGIRVAASGTMLETLEDAGQEAKLQGMDGGEKLVLCMNPIDVTKLRKELGGNATTYDVNATVGFKAIKIETQVGDVTILSEVDVPQGYGWLLDASDLTLRTAGDFPEDITDSNGGLLVDFSDDAKQGRLGAYGNIFRDNPGETIIITWPS